MSLLSLLLTILLLANALPPSSSAVIKPRKIDLSANKLGQKSTRFTTLPDGSTEYEIMAITDNDKSSVVTAGSTWQAVTRKGKLTLNKDKTQANVVWDANADQTVQSGLNYKGRAMELSDLVNFNGHVISPDDKTGLVYEIKGNQAIPWIFLNAGPGNTTDAMKAEWMTLKDGEVYIGGHGTEYIDQNQQVVNRYAMWIKVVSPDGLIKHVDWRRNFNRIRNAAGFPFPGYLTHEAAQWSDIHKRWFFLPRKQSKEIYDEAKDETRGSNLLISTNSYMMDLKKVEVGPLTDPSKGHSAFQFVPGTNDEIIVALKTRESGGTTSSFITVFDITGKIILSDQQLAGNHKFEGLYFI
ncbi:unnamed protein product [Heligmosomoides polygyrus]|uniref:Apyrase n=2 Tax=Heligmosomoides polygyrus TaxID=6339 RepID=A0A3P8AZX2_HELPZ|nr:apyrase-2 [Heligmosomoides bakeri]VDO66025.1 unnamed protein product [Heligmosomoides polygyrus]